MNRDARQKLVSDWAINAFGKEEATNPNQRGLRLVEEAIELAQCAGCDPIKLHDLIDYIYSRPKGGVYQEIGGVSVTLLAFCESVGISADLAEIAEIKRVLSKPLKHFTERNRKKNEAGFKA